MATTWLAPACLIAPVAGKLTFNEEVANRISLIKKSLVVICISGPLRQGKSYLMNCLAKFFLKRNGIEASEKDFGVSSARSAATKGFWVWYLDHAGDKNKGILIVDIEGLGDTASKAYDNCLLCLALLLGSVFVYNVSSETIDNGLIDKLDFVKVSEHIHLQSHQQYGTLYDDPFPVLVISLRNVNLDDEGETDDQYMERRLRELTVHSFEGDYLVLNPSSSFNSPEEEFSKQPEADRCVQYVEEELNINVDGAKIKKLTDYFITRKCFMFPLPTTDDPKNTHKLSDEELKPKFVQKLREFCNYVASNAPVKMLHQKPINGKVLINLLKRYMKHIDKSGSVSRFGDDVNVIIDGNNTFFLEKSVHLFIDEMNSNVKAQLPITMDHLRKASLAGVEKAVNYYLENAYHDGKKDYYEVLKTRLLTEFQKLECLNRERSRRLCNNQLDSLYKRCRTNLVEVRMEYNKCPSAWLTKKLDWYNFIISDFEWTQGEYLTDAKSRYLEDMKQRMADELDELNRQAGKARKNIQDLISKMVSKEYQRKGNQMKSDFDSRIKELEYEKKFLEIAGKSKQSQLVQEEIDRLKAKQQGFLQSVFDFVAKYLDLIVELFSS